MIFNDYVEMLNEQLKEVNKLDSISNEFRKILDKEAKWTGLAFSKAYTGQLGYSTSTGQNNIIKFNELTNRYSEEVREILIGIDFMELGEILSNFKNIGGTCFEKESEELVEEFKNTYRLIHEYKKLTSKEVRADYYNDCIDAIKSMNEIITKFKFMVSFINKINKKLNNNIDDQGLEIRLLTEAVEKDSYNKVVDPAYEIYNKLCEIAGINSKEDEFKIIRMETGSLFVKFIGNKSIIKVMAKMLESVHNVFISNYTREGEKKNLVESTELFKKQFDIVTEMREMGLDVSEHEEIAKETLVLLMKQSNILLSASPDVKINERVLSKAEDIKNILKNNSYALIEDNNSVVNE